MGSRITRLTPMQGFCAETGGGSTLFLTAALGIPVSTTHTITGAIVGVGMVRRASAVRWGIAREIVIAWILTMPASGLLAAAFYAIGQLFAWSATTECGAFPGGAVLFICSLLQLNPT